jgi:hypothetical protein
MTTLTEICQNALYEMSGFEVPQSFYGNGNLTARQCLKLVEREGKTLARYDHWAELISEHTISTVNGTATYAKPSTTSPPSPAKSAPKTSSTTSSRTSASGSKGLRAYKVIFAEK